jgi:shikimate 5-dehydrogenase
MGSAATSGANIYKISGELVGHLTDAQSTKRHLDKSTDKPFPDG